MLQMGDMRGGSPSLGRNENHIIKYKNMIKLKINNYNKNLKITIEILSFNI